MGNYVTQSIETHLFFARIMKEHSLFLEAGFPCKEKEMIQRADRLREEFEELLRRVVLISNGRIGRDILKSQELVTDYTLPAEERTSQLTGIPINSRITEVTRELKARDVGAVERLNTGNSSVSRRPYAGNEKRADPEMVRTVDQLNQRALRLLEELIELKEEILKEEEKGCLYTTNYPLLIRHILREAKLYRSIIAELYEKKGISDQKLREQERFWNQIMMEHALFIRGLLDPSEVELIASADQFATEYKELLELANAQNCRAMDEVTRKSLEETLKYQKFKTAGTEGILDCKIATVILPLLADHVLREANHYIRILETGSEHDDRNQREQGRREQNRSQREQNWSDKGQTGRGQNRYGQNQPMQSRGRDGRGYTDSGDRYAGNSNRTHRSGNCGQRNCVQGTEGQGSRRQDGRERDRCGNCSETAMKGGHGR